MLSRELFFEHLDMEKFEVEKNLSIDNEQFYNLSRKYFEILLNGDFFKLESEMKVLFKPGLIESFKSEFLLVSDERKLSDSQKEALFSNVNKFYLSTGTPQEIEMLPSGIEIEHSKKTPLYGIYYNCRYIPDEVVDTIRQIVIDK